MFVGANCKTNGVGFNGTPGQSTSCSGGAPTLGSSGRSMLAGCVPRYAKALSLRMPAQPEASTKPRSRLMVGSSSNSSAVEAARRNQRALVTERARVRKNFISIYGFRLRGKPFPEF
jgi:hypothetical protein